MNFHPLLVHFPIAFFTLYAALEIFRVKPLTNISFYKPLKGILVILGIISAGFTVIAGKIVERQFTNHALVSLHSHIQEAACIVFGIIALAYFIEWLETSFRISLLSQSNAIGKTLIWYKNIVLSSVVVILLALVGLVLILIGSALGGIIVYGNNLDPFTAMIATLFNLK